MKNPTRLDLAGRLLAATACTLLADQAQFTDVTTSVLTHSGYSHSVAWGDFDGDGDPDLAIAGSVWGGEGNRLVRNDGDGKFTDVTPPAVAATFSQCAAWADYDNDGNLDVFFADYGREHEGGRSSLFRNVGNGDFTNVASGRLLEPLYTGAWADFDNDGYLDLYLAKGAHNLALSRLMRNEQGGRFQDVTKAPLDEHLWGCAWADYDNDNDLDLFVLNNPLAATTNRLFRNEGDGAFSNVAVGPIGGSLGVALGWGDYDNDGDLDMFIGNGWGTPTSSRLLRNDNGTFVDATTVALSNLGAVGGVAWGDYDNDGRLDLFLAKIHQPNQLFRNRGEGVFEDVTSGTLALSAISTSAAWADYDGDGDLDILVAAWLGGYVHLYRNDSADGNHWLEIDLQGGPSNRSAIGARVTLMAGSRTQSREVSGGTGSTSQDALTVHFGVGTNTVIDSVLIRWPSGTLQTMTGIGADQRLRVVETGPTNQPPVITSQPVGRSVYAGDTVRLSVVAWGAWPLAYQWRKDGADLLNATNATLVQTNGRLTDAGDYTVVVRNAFGAAMSAAARVTVTERPWPYFADFEGPAGPEWSHRQTEVTPIGNRRFLGQFGNETVSLRLNGLPDHSAVTVSFDLFVIRSWDANGTCGGGPDIWQLELPGGPPLLRATFSNTATTGVEECPGNQFQSFPGTFPDSVFPAQTGAAERDTLGYFAYGDSVYSMSFTIEHGDPSVRFDFTGMGLQGITDESWGLDNVRIELTPPVGTPYVGTDLSAVVALAAPSPGPVDRLATSGTRALVAVGDYSVALVDLKDPTKPVWLGTWESLFPPSAIVLAGNTAFIASYALDFLSTVEIVDFTDPAQPVLKGYYDTEGYVLDLAVAGNRLYVADDEAGLAVVDLGNPARPVKVGGYTTKRSVQRVAVAGRYAYVADESTLLILDVSDSSYPFRVGLYDLGGPVQDLQVNWGTAYVLVGTGPLEILDVSDPGNVRPLGTHRTWGVQSLAVAGKYAYLAKGSRGLEVVDLSDPARPIWAAGVTTTGSAEDVAVMGPNVVVAGGDKGLLVYRLEQQIYPPLAPPVIAHGLLTLSWPAMEGVRLQRTSELLPAKWEDVAESEETNLVRLAITGSTGFFRLAMGRELLTPTNLVWVEPGTFVMGSPDDEPGRWPWEGPQVTVTISQGFWIGRFEVTQEEYLALMGRNPGRFVGDPRLPVETVTWFEASDYCAALTAREAAAGRLPAHYVYRLPTEAEWEYACRAGTTTRRSYGDDLADVELADYAWYEDNGGGTTHPVGLKRPSPWDLYDMYGNVYEWVQDWWDFSLPGGTAVDPQGPPWHTHKVLKGGNAILDGPARNHRSATRAGLEPALAGSEAGFRVVLAPRLSD